MKRSWSVVLMVMMSLGLLLTGCKKEGGSSVIEALVSKGTAAKLAPDLQVFAEELPGDIEAFGYFDAGKSLDELTKSGLGVEYRQLYEDFTAMAKRRWGVDATKVTGFGLVVHQRQPLLAFVAPAQDPKPGEDIGKVLAAKLGRLTLVGEPGSVLAVIASARQGKRLHQTKPMWLRNALTHAAGNFAFLSGSAESFFAKAPDRIRAQFGDILDGTATLGRDGAGVFVTCKPGRADTVKGIVEAGLGMAKGQVAMMQQELAKREPGPLLAVLLRHYSGVFFKSLEHKVSGDEVSLTLGWHMPSLPKQQGASLAERVVVPGEIGYAQVNLGSPVLETLIAVSDVLKTPLDRAALHKELSAELTKLLGTGGFDPRAFTVSASAAGFIVSLHNAAMGQPGATVPVPGDLLAAVATKWGLALTTPQQRDALTAAVTTPNQGLASDSKILADDKTAMLRGFIDMTKLPVKLPLPVLEMVRSAALSIGEQESLAEVMTVKGQGKAFVAELQKLVDGVMPADEAAYADRAKGSAEMEVLAITQHYQRHQLEKMMKPESVGDDSVRYRMKYDYSGNMRLLTIGAAVGVTAAVALPAFMVYQSRAEMMHMMQEAQDGAKDGGVPDGIPAGDPLLDPNGVPSSDN